MTIINYWFVCVSADTACKSKKYHSSKFIIPRRPFWTQFVICNTENWMISTQECSICKNSRWIAENGKKFMVSANSWLSRIHAHSHSYWLTFLSQIFNTFACKICFKYITFINGVIIILLILYFSPVVSVRSQTLQLK